MAVKKAIVKIIGSVIKFTTGSDEFELDVNDLSGELRHQLMMHGLKQKIADSYAGKTLDREVTEAIKAVMDSLLAGQWNAGRASTGGIWVEALAKAAGATVEEALEKWLEMDEEQQKDIKANPAVKAAKAELELAKAQLKAKDAPKLEL